MMLTFVKEHEVAEEKLSLFGRAGRDCPLLQIIVLHSVFNCSSFPHQHDSFRVSLYQDLHSGYVTAVTFLLKIGMSICIPRIVVDANL
jgi:hypothetical protein